MGVDGGRTRESNAAVRHQPERDAWSVGARPGGGWPMIDDMTGEPLVLNREMEGPEGMSVTAMSQPGGFAVLLRGAPSEPVDWFFVSICYRLLSAGPNQFITRPVLPPERLTHNW